MPVMGRLRWAAGAVLLAAAVPAQAMPVQEFLARWERLNTLGDMAKLDPDLPALLKTLTEIVKGYRIKVEAAATAGKPIACPPPKGEAKFSTETLMVYLKALPTAEQGQELEGATEAFLTKTYPCA
jgi:hypothetical protein